ncbi:MAG: type II secretion system protein [Elusimicrobia bacterium]|nr:type II secretion system protein [Elusimicrobiota bacterium]
MRSSRLHGYTLMELIAVVLIIGILAAFAVPQYLKTVETNKFDDAVGLTNQIGMTNRMFALDHNGAYVDGAFSGVGCGCTSGTCAGYPNPTPAPFNTPCALVCCNYLGDQSWNLKPYTFYACDPGTGSGGGPCGSGQTVSGATRTNGASPGTSFSPYTGWGVYMNSSGGMYSLGGAPNPTY